MQYTSRIQGVAMAAILFAAFACSLALMPRTASAAAVTLSNATTSSSNASTTLMKVGQTLSFQLNLSSSGLAFATSTPVINIFGMGSTTMFAYPGGVVNATTTATTWTYSTTSVSA